LTGVSTVTVEQLAITVRAENDSVAAVRHFVEFAQRILGATADRSIAAVVTSELVANAVAVAAGEITVTIRCVEDNLRVEVHDHGYGMPEVQHPRPIDAGGGRGLMIVEQLADQWGVQQFLPGKIVWFELAPARVDADRHGSMHG
jgi:anti-sigma regulatory factor (Ser/Thr protein kinase)